MADWVALGVVVVAAANASQLDRAGPNARGGPLAVVFAVRVAVSAQDAAHLLAVGGVEPGTGGDRLDACIRPDVRASCCWRTCLWGSSRSCCCCWMSKSQRFGARQTSQRAATSSLGEARDRRSGAGTHAVRQLGGVRSRADLLRRGCGKPPSSALFAVTVGAVLFFVLPRWDVLRREVASTEPLRSVGFSKTVTLGELGEVVNNPDVVMRIEFFRGRESRPFKLDWRAAVPRDRGHAICQRHVDATRPERRRGVATRITFAVRASADHRRADGRGGAVLRFSGVCPAA